MYGAKAAQIREVAVDVWMGGKSTPAQNAIIEQSVFAIYEKPDVKLDTLRLGAELRHEEYRRLVISLADNPLIS